MPPRNTTKMAKPVLDSLAKAICTENVTGSQLTACFGAKRLYCDCRESTKWKKLTYVFEKYQKRYSNSSITLGIVEYLMTPANFIGKEEPYAAQISGINKVLISQGFEINLSGKIKRSDRVTALDEISNKYNSLVNKLKQRGVHEEVLKYCTQELLHENYFHSVFEAAKGLSNRVREMSGIANDGAGLFDMAFAVRDPVLQLNDLSTESLRNQQNGLKSMLNGITYYVRNVTAHEPRIKWIVIESEAVNILMIISFLHSMLDLCYKTNINSLHKGIQMT